MQEENQAPVWASREAFPIKPDAGVFGFQDTKGKQQSFATDDELCEAIAAAKHGVDLVWWPGSSHMLTAAELPFLRPVLERRQRDWARDDLADGKRLSLVFGVIVLWTVYAAHQKKDGAWIEVLESPTVGISLILWLIFGLVPLYEGWKGLRKPLSLDWEKEVQDARFDAWLMGQKAPFTKGLIVVMVLTALGQCYLSAGLSWSMPTLAEVGLLKHKFGTEGGEWWRFFTAPLVHGNLVHWLMNVAGLRYLARRVELLARWPHLMMVFVLSAYMGAYATAWWSPNVPSVGASGGILGLLGFLLVFETLHSRLVPVPARRRLLAGVIMVAVMGVFGFSFIDNAAHAGGLLAGMAYAGLVFPATESVRRPSLAVRDIVAGSAATLVLACATGWCLWRMLLAA